MKHNSYKLIPNRLRKYRRISGLSQVEAGLLLGFKSGNRISRWESGEGYPGALHLFRLSVAYRVLIDALFIDHIRAIRQEMREQERKLLSRRRSKRPKGSHS